MRTHLRQPGFSLVELLVVITALTVLVGLVLPALAESRVQARVTGCLSSVRHVGQGLVLCAHAAQQGLPYLITAWDVQPEGADAGLTEHPGDRLAGL